jgi:hypothetical protein
MFLLYLVTYAPTTYRKVYNKPVHLTQLRVHILFLLLAFSVINRCCNLVTSTQDLEEFIAFKFYTDVILCFADM